jgi:hypothetical protein
VKKNNSSPQHKLVVFGDSIGQGFKNGGVYRTDLSFPAFLRNCWDPAPAFEQPVFTAQAGIPLNLEILTRGLSDELGDNIEWTEYLKAATHLYSTLRRVKKYWEGRIKPLQLPRTIPYHNQSVWGFAMNDGWLMNEKRAHEYIKSHPDNYSLFDMLPDHPMHITAGMVLNPSFSKEFSTHSQLENVQYFQDNGGIENLIISSGPNNIIAAISDLKIIFSEPEDLERLPSLRNYTVYRPEHFEQEYRTLAEKVSKIGPQRVITHTIPYVTIPPVTRGVNADKSVENHSGYFDYYTRFWIWDADFNPDLHPHLTKDEAIMLDQYVDEYNAIIQKVAAEYGWIVAPLNKYVTSMARRRLGGKKHITYPPDFCDAMKRHPMTAHLIENGDSPKLSSEYLRIDPETRKVSRGGIFSLDGLHPATIGYGLIARLYKQTMEKNGVKFDKPLDWDHIISNDTLITNPPYLLVDLRKLLRFFSLGRQEKLAFVGNGLLTQLMGVFSQQRDRK